MSALEIIYIVTGGSALLMTAIFVCSSFRELKPRAALIGLLLLIVFSVVWGGNFFLFAKSTTALLLPVCLLIVFALLFFAPLGKTSALKIRRITEKIDERDVMFAREEYQPGTDKYDRYYAAHPEFKDIDDRLRKLPAILRPEGKFYEAGRSEKVIEMFSKVSALTTQVDGIPAPEQADIDEQTLSEEIKKITLELGADEVGVAKLNPMFVYSHVGRGPEEWGKPIENNHKYAIVFTLEMDYEKVESAPHLPTVEESAGNYLKGAQISIELARRIREMGYPARAHISDSNYQIMLPPVAQDAGLGELGRIGYLISQKFGARIRLGAVTTDLPLVTDKPVTFGVQEFCEKCQKCATNCPSGAIPLDAKVNVRGVEKWPTTVEQCIRYWRIVGTDCALCMKVCPYSHPPTMVHNLVRAGIRRSSFARTVSAWADDFLYGRKIKID